MFLRNQFKGVGMFHLPLVKKQPIQLDSVALIGYDKLSEGETEKIVHFFLDDNKFGSIYSQTEEKVETLKRFKAVLTPDFSMYTEMPTALQLYNCFRNRWVGAYLQSKGVKVIPTVRWGDLESFNYCFDGVEKGSIVAVSTIGLKGDKANFLLGYHEMLRRIRPEAVICYGKPFEEMKGRIIAVDYAETNRLGKNCCVQTVCGHTEFVCIPKGGGSAGGASSGNPKPRWEPKKESDKRFFGEPGEVKRTFIETKNGGYWTDTKIGSDKKAVTERQYTDHGYPSKHSHPHDHPIDWDPETGAPIWGKQINYFDGKVPEFKNYCCWGKNMSTHDKEYYKKLCEEYDGDFKTKDEFKDSVARGSEIVFEWNETEYGIFKQDGDEYFFGTPDESEAGYYTFDELMNYKIGEDRLIDICTKITVIERTF